MPLFKKSYASITKSLSKMAKALVEHAEEHTQAAHDKGRQIVELQADVDFHEEMAKRSTKTYLRLQDLIGG